MVDIAEGKLNYLDLANIFSSLAKKIDPVVRPNQIGK